MAECGAGLRGDWGNEKLVVLLGISRSTPDMASDTLVFWLSTSSGRRRRGLRGDDKFEAVGLRVPVLGVVGVVSEFLGACAEPLRLRVPMTGLFGEGVGLRGLRRPAEGGGVLGLFLLRDKLRTTCEPSASMTSAMVGGACGATETCTEGTDRKRWRSEAAGSTSRARCENVCEYCSGLG
jgi:hypothetical protein